MYERNVHNSLEQLWILQKSGWRKPCFSFRVKIILLTALQYKWKWWRKPLKNPRTTSQNTMSRSPPTLTLLLFMYNTFQTIQRRNSFLNFSYNLHYRAPKISTTIGIFSKIIWHLHNTFIFIQHFQNKPLFDSPLWDKSFSFSLRHSDQVRCPNILLFDGHRGLLTSNKVTGPWTLTLTSA